MYLQVAHTLSNCLHGGGIRGHVRIAVLDAGTVVVTSRAFLPVSLQLQIEPGLLLSCRRIGVLLTGPSDVLSAER
jgi:hypothetical protein